MQNYVLNKEFEKIIKKLNWPFIEAARSENWGQ
jgi:hypothetical protein